MALPERRKIPARIQARQRLRCHGCVQRMPIGSGLSIAPGATARRSTARSERDRSIEFLAPATRAPRDHFRPQVLRLPRRTAPRRHQTFRRTGAVPTSIVNAQGCDRQQPAVSLITGCRRTLRQLRMHGQPGRRDHLAPSAAATQQRAEPVTWAPRRGSWDTPSGWPRKAAVAGTGHA